MLAGLPLKAPKPALATLYCDESGGVGRGVMTLAALLIAPEDAAHILHRFRAVTGYHGEVKGSRIALGERGFLIEMLAQSSAQAVVTLALSATQPQPGEDKGLHDVHVYAALLETAVSKMLPLMDDCRTVMIDDGRYGDATLALIRNDVRTLIGPCGSAELQLSHHADGLQLADVIANSFFTRALPGDRQAHMAALVQPLMERGQIQMQILTAEAQREYEPRKQQKRRDGKADQ
ncbi:MAG: hypothetical protein RL764_180 [Pseudomonadota bacterium]|jgi:hypothetical protein